MPKFSVEIFALVGAALSCAAVAADSAVSSAAWSRFAARAEAALQYSAETRPVGITAGSVQLSFREFFGPVGDRGLEYSERLRALEGQTVTVTGYMVRDPDRPRGLFILAGSPVRLEQSLVCSQTELPTATAYVLLDDGSALAPYRPGCVSVTGRLEVGPRSEADGRNSTLRLRLDAAATATFLSGGFVTSAN
jgi:hypothetical protein